MRNNKASDSGKAWEQGYHRMTRVQQYTYLKQDIYHQQTSKNVVETVDQLWRECLSHEYHYPLFWWSKLAVVLVRRLLDIDFEVH